MIGLWARGGDAQIPTATSTRKPWPADGDKMHEELLLARTSAGEHPLRKSQSLMRRRSWRVLDVARGGGERDAEAKRPCSCGRSKAIGRERPLAQQVDTNGGSCATCRGAIRSDFASRAGEGRESQRPSARRASTR